MQFVYHKKYCSLCTHACYAQSVVNILLVVHCLLVFIVNSLAVAYEWLAGHISFV